MVSVLVSVASRHGSADQIGKAIAAHLQEGGGEAVVVPPSQVHGLDGFDAVVVGSAIYAGHWLREARQLVEEHQDELRRRPVWLFSVGPLGDPPTPVPDSAEVARLMTAIQARGHHVFAGSLERRQLGLIERAVIGLVRAPLGDFRDWSAIADWARGVVNELHRVAAA